MKKTLWRCSPWLLLSLLGHISTAQADIGQFSGWVNGQLRWFPETGETVEEQNYPSLAVQLEHYISLGDNDQLTTTLFGRYDLTDTERRYADIRELLWTHFADGFETRVGIGQVTWGVNEIFKTTDLVNQTDRSEIPFQRKLGQPMAGLSFYWGEDLIELYTLYGQRPAYYPGDDGRLNYPIRIDDEAEYERGDFGKWELAGRWKTRLGNADLSFAHFYGIARDAYFIFNTDFADPKMIPVYERVNQSAVNVVYPAGDFLLKGEYTYQAGAQEAYHSVAGGFEFTQGAIFESNLDLTWYVEAIWDSRDQVNGTLFDHDIGVAARIAFNDARDSNLIASVVADYEYDEFVGYFLWITTLGEHWSMNFSGQYFYGNEPRLDPRDYIDDSLRLVAAIRAEDYPIPAEIISDIADSFSGTTISETQFRRIEAQLRAIQRDESLFDDADLNTVPQTLFDLIRISDNSQKLNLIERDGYIQVDIYYHF